MIKGSICPLKRRVIFATNFTEVFVPKKMQELKFELVVRESYSLQRKIKGSMPPYDVTF